MNADAPSFPPIEQLLPQRGAMRLLTRLLHADSQGAAAEAVVSARWPGVVGAASGADPAAGAAAGADPALAVELIGQTAAAWMAAEQAPAAPRAGMLVGVSRARFVPAALRPAQRLRVEVETVWEREALRQIRGRVLRLPDPSPGPAGSETGSEPAPDQEPGQQRAPDPRRAQGNEQREPVEIATAEVQVAVGPAIDEALNTGGPAQGPPRE